MIPTDLQHKVEEARKALLTQDFSRALSAYEKLTRLLPNSGILWFEYGNAAAQVREKQLAIRAWQRAISLEPRNCELITLIGHQYKDLRKPERAIECFALAAAADPRAMNPRISRAVLAEQRHRLDEAHAAIEECFALDPNDDQARYFAAVLERREDKLAQAETRLRDLIAGNPKHPYVRYASRYELAQILDRNGRFEEAFRLLTEAKQLVRELTDTELLLKGYDQGAERARRFTRAQPANILTTWASYFQKAKREPIPSLGFLGGHPRSGTTLLEQVLDAHPSIAALDEPPAFTEVLEPAFHKTREHSSTRLNTLRQMYLRALLEDLPADAANKLLIDKNPSPTARLPVWLRVFPELKVLIALRDPRDVVLSCYFQNIPLNATNVNFLTLERTAKHYSYLMDIWLTVREWSGFSWLETRYEDVVAGLEAEGRRVTEFLGLQWHEQQARFYEKSRAKQLYSPTYQDVTRPVYKRSVGRWQAYEKYLAPVLPALEPYCRKFGYE